MITKERLKLNEDRGIFLDCKACLLYTLELLFLKGKMKKNSFEKDLKGLEDIVAKLEGDEVSLDEAMALFEEGVKISRLCAEKLDKAQHKVEILTKDKEGKLKTEPFDPVD